MEKTHLASFGLPVKRVSLRATYLILRVEAAADCTGPPANPEFFQLSR